MSAVTPISEEGIEVYSLVKNFRPHTKLTLNDGFYFWIDKSEWTDDK